MSTEALRTGARLARLSLRLRPAAESDLDAIQGIGNSSDSRWFGVPHPCTRQSAEEVLTQIRRGWHGTFGLSAIVSAVASEEIVAFVGAHRRSADVVEIAYGVAPHARGRGIATATAGDVSTQILQQAWASRVEAVIEPGNAASIHLVQGLGFTYSGTRDQRLYDGSVVTDHVYVLR